MSYNNNNNNNNNVLKIVALINIFVETMINFFQDSLMTRVHKNSIYLKYLYKCLYGHFWSV